MFHRSAGQEVFDRLFRQLGRRLLAGLFLDRDLVTGLRRHRLGEDRSGGDMHGEQEEACSQQLSLIHI